MFYEITKLKYLYVYLFKEYWDFLDNEYKTTYGFGSDYMSPTL